MLGWLTGRSEAQRTAEQLYGRVVAAARQPRLYEEFSVPDTVEGRFEMVVLHLFLALDALRQSADERGGEEVTRLAIEAFVTDMDDSMREQGVGDLTVPKKVRRAAAGFYERSGDYRTALTTADGALAPALQTHIGLTPDAARELAAYVRTQSRDLDGARAADMFTSAEAQ